MTKKIKSTLSIIITLTWPIWIIPIGIVMFLIIGTYIIYMITDSILEEFIKER